MNNLKTLAQTATCERLGSFLRLFAEAEEKYFKNAKMK